MSPEYIRYKNMVSVLDNYVAKIGKGITTLMNSIEFLSSNPMNRPIKEFAEEMLSLKVELDIQERLQVEVYAMRKELTDKSFISIAGVNKQ